MEKETLNFINTLFEVRIIGHIAHLQSTSLAEHLAFGELYEGIVPLTDDYVETYQGIYGIVKGYSDLNIVENIDMIVYLKSVIEISREYRDKVQESELQQMVDNVIEFLNKIIYKLKFLK